MNITIRTKETTEGDANKLTLSNEDMGDTHYLNMSVPLQDKTGKEVGRMDMIVDPVELAEALVQLLDAIMESKPSRELADATNKLSEVIEND